MVGFSQLLFIDARQFALFAAPQSPYRKGLYDCRLVCLLQVVFQEEGVRRTSLFLGGALFDYSELSHWESGYSEG